MGSGRSLSRRHLLHLSARLAAATTATTVTAACRTNNTAPPDAGSANPTPSGPLNAALSYLSADGQQRQQAEKAIFDDVTRELRGVTVAVNGVASWDDAKKKCVMDSPDFQKGVQFWRDLTASRHLAPTDAEAAQLAGGQNVDVFASGKVAMQVVSSIQAALPFKWAVASLPYSGPTGSKNVSGRTRTHVLLMGQTKGADREATWQVLRWLQRPENAGRFPLAAGHVVSPFKNPAASDLAQSQYRDQFRVDPKPLLLQAQNTRPAGWGMAKYPGFDKVGPELHRRYTQEFLIGQIDAQAYATWATKYVDSNLGAK
jgi:ABC-type glycerol-3-phosphate transport system substrate-binding protein